MKSPLPVIRLLRLLALAFAMAAALADAAICQFNQTSGAWNVPANWNNCTGGNGIPANTPGPADRAEITGATVIIPAGAFSVGDLYLGAAVIQGAGLVSTTLNVVAAGTIAWGSGAYTFRNLTANFTSTATIPAANGPLTIDTAVVALTPGTSMLADTVTITGAGAQIINGSTFQPSTSLTMLLGGTFLNDATGLFTPGSPLAINGPFVNAGNFQTNGTFAVSMTNAAAFSQTASSGLISGLGNITAIGQTLTLAGGFVEGTPTFTVGTLINTGATIRPGGSGAIGTINIFGNYQQQRISALQYGKLEFDLAGVGSVDQLLVSGSATLGGDIGRGAVGTFAPPVGTILDVLIAGSVTGGFDSGSELIVFDAPRRYVEVISATKVSLRANETVWVIGSTDDVSPTQPSLRNAIARFNAEAGSSCVNGPYRFDFLLGTGNTTIQPATGLPAISGCPNLFIDGYSQTGAAANTSPADWNAVLPVTLSGASCPGCFGLLITAPGTDVRGINFANWPSAIQIGSLADNVVIKGNYFFQGNFGVEYNGSTGVKIGDSGDPAFRNVFVHAANVGVLLNGGTGVTVANNLIGLGAGGTPGPNGFGIQVNSAVNALLPNNVIANNGKGITVNAGSGMDYRGSRIFANTIIGVDLNNDGPTANDDAAPPYDTDSGANQLLNFPKIVSLTPFSASVATVNYEVKSTPNSQIDLFFCINPPGQSQCAVIDPVVAGITTDASGFASGSRTMTGLNANDTITLYAYANTGPKAGNTSEISPAVAFAAPGTPGISVTGTATFPNTPVGASSAVQAITITNTGTATLTLNAITATNTNIFADTTGGPAPNAAHWCGFGSTAGGAPNTGAPINLAPGATCVLNIAFTPNAVGSLSSNIGITSNAPTSSVAYVLNGTGTAPACGNTEVTNTNDSGTCSLRAAITYANSNCGSGPYTITFNIPGAGPHLIQPASALPAVTCPSTVINGYSQPGSVVNSAPAGQTNADIRIRLDGALASAASGVEFALSVPGIVRGLSITGFNIGVNAYTNVDVRGNFIGVLPDGVTPAKNANGVSGAFNALGGQCCVRVGSAAAADVNLIAATTNAVQYIGNDSGQVINNLIGYDRNGNRAPALGSSVGIGTGPAAFNTQMRNNWIAHLNTVVSTQGGTLLFSRNSAVLSPIQRASTTVLYSEVEITRVVYDVSANSTTLQGNINAKGASLHRVEAFNNPTPFGQTQTETHVGDIVLNPTGVGLFPFTQSFPGLLANPSVTMTFLANNETFDPLGFRKAISVAGAPAAFTMTAGGAAASQTLVVTNATASALTFGATPAVATGTGFSVTGGTCAGATVPSAGTCSVVVSYSSPVATTASGSLDIAATVSGQNVTNGSIPVDTVIRFALSGTATAAGAPAVTLSVASLTFASQSVGSSSGTQAVTITNSGTVTLNLSSIVTSGDFLSTNSCGATLVATAQCTVFVTFTPAASGTRSGTLTITSDATGSPHTVTLTGTGVAPAGPFAYILNSGTSNISVIDVPTNAVIATIPGAPSNPGGIAVNTAGTRVYFGDLGFGTLSTIDTATNTITSVLPVGSATLGVALSASGAFAYVGDILANTVSVVNTSTNTVVATIPNGTRPWGIAVNPAGTRVYVANINANTVSVINTATNTVLTTIPVGAQPYAVTVNSAGTFAYVTNQGAGNVSVIDTATNSVVATLSTGASLRGMALNPAGTRAYVANFSANSLSVFDLTTNTGIVAVPVGTSPIGVSVDPTGSFAYVTNTGSNNVSVISTATNTVVATVPVGTSPSSIGQFIRPAAVAGPSPAITVSPTSPVFPTTTVGISTSGRNFILTNTGAATLTITGITHSNPAVFPDTNGGPAPNAAHYCGFGSAAGGVPNTGAPINIAPGGTCTLRISFVPNAVAALSGTLTINSNAPTSPTTITFNGNGAGYPAITSVNPPNTGTVGVPYTYALTAVGVPSTMTWSIVAGSLPTGVSLNSVTGLISGTPTVAGSYGVSITASNGVLPDASIGIAVVIAAAATVAPIINSVAPPNGTTGTAYSHTFTATGTTPITWSVATGTLPTGVTLNSTSGVLSGTPTVAGSFAFTVQAANGTLPDATQNVTILITTLAPAVTLTPPGPLSFGTRTTNTTSPAQTVTLSNSGTAGLVISSITGSGDFGFTTTCPLSTPPLAPAGSCAINITFTPLTVASLTGSITITSNAPGSPHTISLTGTGSAIPVPGLAVSASSLNFGSQRLGASSSAQTVVVTNTGFGTLLLTGISATSPFSRLNIGPAQGDCGTSLAPGLTCQIAVVFTPTVIGAATGQLSIASNASANPFVVSLSGSGAAVSLPQISLGRALDFGDQVINTSASLPLVISNSGGADLTISGITITGTNATSFATSGTCATIPANASCTLTVTFTPAGTGAKSATLTIASNSGPVGNAASAGSIVNLSGNGILAPRPVAQLSMTGLGFGNTIFGGATPNQLITLTNIGGVAMSIATILTTGDYIQTNSCGASLNPTASCVINVSFSPLGIGNRNGELQVFTNADGSPHRVQLSGTGCRWFSQPLSRFFLTACGG